MIPSAFLRASMFVALLLAVSANSVHAQAGASTGLMGRVTDSSGAAIPGVAVTITNLGTGSERTITTGATGEWEVRFLAPGNYRVTFELTGFKTLRREGISVSTAEMATMDVALELGALDRIDDAVGHDVLAARELRGLTEQKGAPGG